MMVSSWRSCSVRVILTFLKICEQRMSWTVVLVMVRMSYSECKGRYLWTCGEEVSLSA